MRHLADLTWTLARLTTASLFLLAAAQPALGNQAEEAPQPPPAAAEPVPPPMPIPVPVPPERPPEIAVPMVASGTLAPTDHDGVVGRWGIEARRMATVQRTHGQDPTCGNDCPVDLNVFSVRRWVSRAYAYSLGLALVVGGGSTRSGSGAETWDTYFGVGPTVGANFLMANFQHLAVSFAPQLDTAIFVPSSSAAKTLMVNARGLFEGELHLGFWGVPQLSVGVSSGLVGSFSYISSGKNNVNNGNPATVWTLSTTAPQSLWGLVTNMFVRFYL
jgi:hypothetical protein